MLGWLSRKRGAPASAHGPAEALAAAYAEHQAGRLEEAQSGYRSVLAADPRNFDAEYLLGVLLLQRGDPDQAAGHFERAVGIAPASAPAHNSLGVAYLRLGRLQQALASLRRSTQLDAQYAEAHYNLGSALRSLGQGHEAIEAFRRATDLNPGLTDAHAYLSAALREAGKPDAALESAQRALALNPSSALLHLNAGDALREKGYMEEAAAAYRAALEREPRLPQAHNNLGNVLRHLGRYDEALACYERALTVQPDFAEALLNAAQVMRENRRLADAATACRLLLQMRPQMAEAHLELGNILKGMGEVRGALECYARALDVEPENAEARWALTMSRPPMIADDEAEQAEGRKAFAEDLANLEQWCAQRGWSKTAQAVGSQQPFYLAYQEEDHRESIARYGALCGSLMHAWQTATGLPFPARVTRAERRIGIVSAHIRDHSVWNAISKGWLQHLDRGRYELRLFHLGTANDTETAFAKTHATHYSYGRSDFFEWTKLILGHQLDVLIYPEIGMDPTTARLASLRLAPVQATSWGHPHTSGLPTIDYFLSADAFEPPGAEAHYTEQLVRLPGLGSAYGPSNVRPAPADHAALGLRPDMPILVCPGTPFKYTPRHDRLFIDIARRLGECQFVFFMPEPAQPMQRVRQRLQRSFAAAGLELDAFAVFLPWLSRAAFYGLMREADVYLDTVGYSGFNTAVQAIECGLPVVTREGRFLRGRLASGTLRHLGLDELVTDSDAAYVESVVRLARNAAYWGDMQARIVASRSALYNDASSVRALEALFERALS